MTEVSRGRRSKIRIRIDETCNEGHLVFDWSANLNTTIIQPKAIKHYKTKITNKKGKTCSIGCFVFDWPGTRDFLCTRSCVALRAADLELSGQDAFRARISKNWPFRCLEEDYWYTDRKTKKNKKKIKIHWQKSTKTEKSTKTKTDTNMSAANDLTDESRLLIARIPR